MAEKKPTETPMMKQYFAFKAEHPEAVLLFRCGDFYETYGDDALIASKVLGIVLTKRSSAVHLKHIFHDSSVPVTKWLCAISWKTQNLQKAL